jgi:RHS repeat-associated protein
MFGSEFGQGVTVVGIAATLDFDGYWLVDSTGKAHPFGDAQSYSPSNVQSVAIAGSTFAPSPVVGMAVTSDAQGYWVLQSNGDVISYGDAQDGYNGPAGTQPPTGDTFVGIAAGQQSVGYWLADATGHVYPFGNVVSYGNPAGNMPLGAQIVSINALPLLPGYHPTAGYWVSDNHGNVYPYGIAGSYGSLSANQYSTIGGMAVSSDGRGFFLYSTDGSTFAFGDAALPAPTVDASVFGETVDSTINQPTTTPPLTTRSPGDVLVALVAANGPVGQSVSVTGAGLTWSPIQRENANEGDVEIWTATAPSTLSGATITSTPAFFGYDLYMTVEAFTGAVAVGTSSIAASTTAESTGGVANVSLTTTGSNSLVYGVGLDVSTSNAVLIGSGESGNTYSPQHIGETGWFQHLDSPVAAPTSIVDVTDSGVGSDTWSVAAVEIVANPASPNANLYATGPDPYVGIVSSGSGYGYWATDNHGNVYTIGDAQSHGSLSSVWGIFVSNIVGIAATPGGGGYWLAGADGSVYTFGDASFYNSIPGLGIRLSHSIVGIVSSFGYPGHQGYWLVGADGGVFSFGPTATYYGSLPGLGDSVHDVTAMASNANGNGYWVVEGDGKVTGFGAQSNDQYGDASHVGLNAPIVGIVPFTSPTIGYWLVGADGGVFTYPSNGPYYNSIPGEGGLPAGPIASIATPPQTSMLCYSTCGYTLLSQEGEAYPFGNVYGGTLPFEFPAPSPQPPASGNQPQPSQPQPSNSGSGGSNPSNNKPTHCAGDPVDCSTGDLNESVTDVSVPGIGPSLDLTRTYNSLDARHAGLFGFGWTSSYEANLSFNTADGSALATLPDGSTVSFAETATGYVAPPGDQASLTASSGSYTLVVRQTETYTFNGSGQLTSMSDQNGFTTTLGYTTMLVNQNPTNELHTVTDPSGRSLTFTFNPSGFVSQVSDPAGNALHYTYNLTTNSQGLPLSSQYGNLISVSDRNGGTTRYTYDNANHLMLTLKDPNANKTQNVYDGEGRVIAQVNPAGQTTTWAYSGANDSASGGATVITDGHGSVTLENFVGGQMVSRTTALGTPEATIATYTYDPLTGGATSSTDPNFHTTSTGYDQSGNVAQSQDATTQAVTSTTYNLSTNSPITTTDPTDAVTTDTYYQSSAHPASANLQQEQVQPSPGCASNCAPLTTNYQRCQSASCSAPVVVSADGTTAPANYVFGELESVTDPAGDVTAYTYDGNGDVTSTITNPTSGQYDITDDFYNALREKVCQLSPSAVANGDTVANSCPQWPQPPSKTPPPRGVSTWGFDGDGNVMWSYDGDGQLTTYTFDGDGNELTQVDGAGNEIYMVYDLLGRLWTKTTGYGTSSAQTTTYTYDVPYGTGSCTASSAANALYCDEVTIGSQVTITYYDAANQVVETAGPVMTTTLAYDPAGNLATKTTPAGTTSYAYDADNRVTKVSFSSASGTSYTQSPTVSYRYFPNGERRSMLDGIGRTSYAYDSFGRLQTTKDDFGSTVSYGYDLDDRVNLLTYPNNQSVTYHYDGAGEMYSVTDFAGHVSTFTYPLTSSYGGPSTIASYPGGTGVSTYFDPAGHVAAVVADGTGSSALTMTYTIDPGTGQIQSESDNAGQPSALSVTNGYNASYQLKSSTSSNSLDMGTYSYDASGNPTSVLNTSTGTQQTQTPKTNGSGELATTMNSGTTTTYGYDGIGDRISASSTPGGTATYAYDQNGELMTVAGAQYQYNGDGLRMYKGTSAGGETFAYNTQSSTPQLLADNLGSTSTYFIYGPDGQAFEQVASSGSATFLVHDALGSTRGLFDQSGNLVGTYNYSAYGNVLSHTGNATPLGYAGAYTDAESGFLYLVNRYYDPETGQFLSVDPLVDTTGQPYSYANDDPVNASDPNGLNTEGYCLDLTLGFAGSNVGGTFCIVEANGNQQVGYTFTVHGTVGVSSNLIAATLASKPPSIGSLFGGGLSVVYQTSNANAICQLGGGFKTIGGSGQVGPVTASYQHFFGSNVSGNDFGIGLATGVGGISYGIGYEDTVVANTFSGTAATLAANVITGLNDANPLHWLAGPLGLY